MMDFDAEATPARGPDLRFVRGWLGRYWLAIWFGVIFAIRLTAIVGENIGFDARLYLAATRAWLAGDEPWIVLLHQQFAAPPPTLLPLVPFTFLPESVGIATLIALSAFGVVLTIRLVGLPWWWLLFPPFLDSVMSGNPQGLLVPLILVGAGPVAAFLKVYALIPIVLTLRWRALLVTFGALLVTAPMLPWASYVAHLAELSTALTNQSSGGLSATAIPWLIPIAVVALIMCGREKAAWLAVPVVWPATQWYYSTLAVPALKGAPVAAALMAINIPGATVAAAIIIAWQARLFTLDRLRAAWVVRGPVAPADGQS
ncbi:MAG: hypothetical protein H0U37_06715 [Chloroflexi bacterium]|nr:hypothetical protein [Chloroflexota bacterium]